jgi:hypothetical protein
MEPWWIYEVPNAQVAFDAVLAVEARYTPDEITGLAIISREGSDDRDHLYLCAASKNPPNGRLEGVEEFLGGFGRRCPYTIDDINGPGINFLASGPAESILTLLLLQYPGDIEIHRAEDSPRIYWVG